MEHFVQTGFLFNIGKHSYTSIHPDDTANKLVFHGLALQSQLCVSPNFTPTSFNHKSLSGMADKEEPRD